MKEFNLVQMLYYNNATNNEVRKGYIFLSPKVNIDIDGDLMCIRTEDYISIGNRIKFIYSDDVSKCITKCKLRDNENNIDIDLDKIKYITCKLNYFIIFTTDDNLIFTENIELVAI